MRVSGIFISYRRDDSRGTAGRLYDDLKDRFGGDQVFRDLDAIRPGADYEAAISDFIRTCDALVVVIGDHWLDIRNNLGGRRLDDPDDLVRQEVMAGLRAGKQVIPVLVDDAKMPDRSQLPQPLVPLAHRRALPVSDSRWEYDVGLLVSQLAQLVPRATEARGSTPPAGTMARWETSAQPNAWAGPPTPGGVGSRTSGNGVPGWAWGGGVATVVAIALVIFAIVRLDGGSSNSRTASDTPTTIDKAPATTGSVAPPPVPVGETAIALSPTSGHVGTVITVSGSGFDPVETVEISFFVGVLATIVTDAKGAFSDATIKVPADAMRGFPYSVHATGRRSIKTGMAPFAVN